jgi:hypothetical protein
MAFHVSSPLPSRFLLPPYLIQTPAAMGISTDFTSVTISRNSVSRKAPIILIGRTPDGGLHGLPLLPAADELKDGLRRTTRGHDPPLRSLKVRWDSDVAELAKAFEVDDTENSNDEDAGDSADTRYSVLSCRWAWIGKSLNRLAIRMFTHMSTAVNSDSRSEAEESQATSSVDDYVRALREMDAPLDYYMTP